VGDRAAVRAGPGGHATRQCADRRPPGAPARGSGRWNRRSIPPRPGR
jgi:hypothetical protein